MLVSTLEVLRCLRMYLRILWNIINPINVSESFRWIMVLFRISHKCLYVYDLFNGGVVNTNNVHHHVQSLSTMRPLFFIANNFYSKKVDINWHREPIYIGKSMIDPLNYVLVRNAP